MKILLIGSGGREHALAWKLAQSARVTTLVAAPGNAGIARLAQVRASGMATAELVELARRESPDLVVVGPEAPLVEGAADALSAEGFRVFGPGRAAARLEGSKAHAKEFMARHEIPTARHRTFAARDEAIEHLHRLGAPVVVKDSGLASGKGVTVAERLEDAVSAVERVFAGGPTSGRVVIEDRLRGQEISYLAFTDGRSYLPMPLAQDYKQAQDGDHGAMTGGMGAVAPVALLSERSRERVEREIVERTLAGLRSDGIDYRGVLYFGIMLTEEGPRLLEYNVRLGDPETQVVLPLLDGDLVEVIEAVIDGRLGEIRVAWREGAAACVVMAAPGYPGPYPTGLRLDPFEPDERLLLFHAGTAIADRGLVSSGGRVFGVVALGETVPEAVALAYRGIDRVGFDGAHFRRDIGSRLPKG